jgi:acyl carrier protein
LQLQPREVDPDLPFADYGVDSLMIADFVGGLEAALGTPVNPTALVSHPTARRLAEWLASGSQRKPSSSAGDAASAATLREGHQGHAAEPDMLALLRAVAAGSVHESEALRRLRGRAP